MNLSSLSISSTLGDVLIYIFYLSHKRFHLKVNSRNVLVTVDFWLFSLNGFNFMILLRDGENDLLQEKPTSDFTTTRLK